jgi:predicted DNA-binding transcriptional regulator AlpA
MAKRTPKGDAPPPKRAQPGPIQRATPIHPEAFLRLPQVLELHPVSESWWWYGIEKGWYPKGIKLSPKVTVWQAWEILDLNDSYRPQLQQLPKATNGKPEWASDSPGAAEARQPGAQRR